MRPWSLCVLQWAASIFPRFTKHWEQVTSKHKRWEKCIQGGMNVSVFHWLICVLFRLCFDKCPWAPTPCKEIEVLLYVECSLWVMLSYVFYYIQIIYIQFSLHPLDSSEHRCVNTHTHTHHVRDRSTGKSQRLRSDMPSNWDNGRFCSTYISCTLTLCNVSLLSMSTHSISLISLIEIVVNGTGSGVSPTIY